LVTVSRKSWILTYNKDFPIHCHAGGREFESRRPR